MFVLGIETSCDETSVAVVSDGKKVLSNEVSSSERFHKRYGGVVPEIASRLQLETIAEVADSAIIDSRIKLKDINLISVTSEPGLPGSLLVGLAFANSLALTLKVPVLEVNHVYSHIYANFLNGAGVKMPFIALVISGGHTSLFYVRDFKSIEVLGETQDDASGEAFDKVAKILGLGYPGGPLIEKLALKGDPNKIKFRCSGTKHPLNFSFSGIKTAVLYYVEKHKAHSLKHKAHIAASFQKAVIDALIEKSFLACRLKKSTRLVIGGGVAANNFLREEFNCQAKLYNIECYFPAKGLCMDNAAMVAGYGYQLFRKNRFKYGFSRIN